MSSGFTTADFWRLMDPAFELVGYGEAEWEEVNGMWRGMFEVAAPSDGYSLVVRPMIMLRPKRPSEPTYLLNLNGCLAIRVDINQIHRFDGEPRSRRASHVQSHPNGSGAPQVTVEITDGGFPRISAHVNLSYELQVRACFTAAAQRLNMNVDGVGITPLPFHPGGGYQ